jgi:DNA-binding LacI/PurR family transcriptional regulator
MNWIAKRGTTMPVTIYDISKRAGISASTVSRALSNNSLVNESTREKIIKIAKEMGYHPNSSARNLRTGKSNTAAFITDNLASPLASAMAAGAESWFRERGWTLFIGQGGPNFGEVNPFLSLLKQGHIAGIILAGTWIRVFDDAWISPDTPVVCALCIPSSSRYPTVLTDDFGGGYTATEHLIKQGYRRIAMINGPRTWHASQERLKGFRKALTDYNVPYDSNLIRYGDWKIDSGYQYTKELLSLESRPDAIFVGNDFMAVGAVQVAQELCLSIPNQIGIIGFDNREITQTTRPKLSSIELPLYEVGRAAARSLLYSIEPNKVDDTAPIAISGEEPLLIKCQPVIRGTSASDVSTDQDKFPFL